MVYNGDILKLIATRENMDKFLCKSPQERNELFRQLADEAPEDIKRMAHQLTVIKGVGFLTAIELLVIVGRYALKDIGNGESS